MLSDNYYTVPNPLSIQDLAGLAYDAAHVISQAVNREPCALMNGSSISPNTTDALSSCIIKVNYSWIDVGYTFYSNLLTLMTFKSSRFLNP